MKRLLRFLFAAVAALPSALAVGPITFGVRGGVPLTDMINYVPNSLGFSSGTRDFTVGPTFGINLPHRVSIEGDALYKRFNVNAPAEAGRIVSVGANSWEFPIMLKYRLAGGVISPVIGAGGSFRHWSGYGSALDIATGNVSGTTPIIQDNDNVGFVANAGLRFNFFVMKLTPEFRYTRWTRENVNSAATAGTLYTKKDQFDILLGLTF